MAQQNNKSPKRAQGIGKPDMTRERGAPGPFANRDVKDGGRATEFLSDMTDAKTFNRP